MTTISSWKVGVKNSEEHESAPSIHEPGCFSICSSYDSLEWRQFIR
jgi:hypothetical protein